MICSNDDLAEALDISKWFAQSGHDLRYFLSWVAAFSCTAANPTATCAIQCAVEVIEICMPICMFICRHCNGKQIS